MTRDARFEDGGAAPLNLGAMDAEDLQVISALVQDAVLPASEMCYESRARRFVLLVNRLRHEDIAAADRAGRPVERVRALLAFDGVLGVASQGIGPRDADTVLQVLAVAFEPGDPPGGHVVITFAGDGALRARVEALDARLRDVTRPYRAPSGKVPRHDD